MRASAHRSEPRRAGGPSRGRRPLLARALSTILPTPDQTWLLRACLLSGDAATHAWRMYEQRVGDLVEVFREDTRGLKRLGPLLYDSLQRNAIPAPSRVLTALRTACLREELRTRECRRITAEILTALSEADIPVIVLKGTALGELVYRNPALRHSHDVELLFRDETELARARVALESRGLGRACPVTLGRVDGVTLGHPSGLPIVLHRTLFFEPYYRSEPGELWSTSRQREVAGVPARVLSPEDNLLHVAGHASYAWTRESLLWVCDAWLLAAHGTGVDWGRLLQLAAASRLLLPVSVVLDYLARDLEAPVPAPCLARADDALARVDAIGRDVALFGARAVGGTGLSNLLGAANGWTERALLLRWLLLPSAGYIRHAYGVRQEPLLPLYYARRVLAHARGRLWPAGRNGR